MCSQDVTYDMASANTQSEHVLFAVTNNMRRTPRANQYYNYNTSSSPGKSTVSSKNYICLVSILATDASA